MFDNQLCKSLKIRHRIFTLSLAPTPSSTNPRTTLVRRQQNKFGHLLEFNLHLLSGPHDQRSNSTRNLILRPVVLSDGAMTIALKDVQDAWRSLYGNTNK